MLNKAINPIGICTHTHIPHTPHTPYKLLFQSFSNNITAALVHCKYYNLMILVNLMLMHAIFCLDFDMDIKPNPRNVL